MTLELGGIRVGHAGQGLGAQVERRHGAAMVAKRDAQLPGSAGVRTHE